MSIKNWLPGESKRLLLTLCLVLLCGFLWMTVGDDPQVTSFADEVIDDFKENFVKETLKMEPLEVMDERLADKFLPLQDDNESPSDSSDSDSIYGSWDSEDWALGADWTVMPWVVEPYLAFDPGLQLHPQITISANITQSGYMVCILATGTVNLDYSRAASDVLDEHLEGENVEIIDVEWGYEDDDAYAPSVTFDDMDWLWGDDYSFVCVAVADDTYDLTNASVISWTVPSCTGAGSLGACDRCFNDTACGTGLECHRTARLCVQIGQDAPSCQAAPANCNADCVIGPLAAPQGGHQFPGCTCSNPEFPRHWQSIPCCGGHDWCGVSLEAQCVVDAQCDPADGHCIYEDQPDGTPCDDDDENTANNTCQGGVCDGDWICSSETCGTCPDGWSCEWNDGCFWDLNDGVCKPQVVSNNTFYFLEFAPGLNKAWYPYLEKTLCCFANHNELKALYKSPITITDADGFISPDPDSSSDDPYYMVEYKFGVLDQSEYFDHQEALDYGDDGVLVPVSQYLDPANLNAAPARVVRVQPQPFTISDYRAPMPSFQEILDTIPWPKPHGPGNRTGPAHDIHLLPEKYYRFPLESAAGRIKFRTSATTKIQTTYTANFPQQFRTVFEAAVAKFEAALNPTANIYIQAEWKPLGADTLGMAGPTGAYYSQGWTSLIVPSLYWQLRGGRGSDNSFDATLTMSSQFAWYAGTDGNPPADEFDFLTVVLHELAHCLGFLGVANVQDAALEPFTFDTLVQNQAGQRIATVTLANRKRQLQGGTVYFTGKKAVAANGGQKVKLYTPVTWQPGSSYSHWDLNVWSGTNVDRLMEYAGAPGEAFITLGPVTQAMFGDLGYKVVVGGASNPCKPNPCQNSGTCTASGGGFSCACKAGTTGSTCQIKDPCAPTSPCKNGGICTSAAGKAKCACVNGWTDSLCKTPPADPCSPNPCRNSGTCSSSNNAASCQCATGWTGTRCQTRADPCATNPCKNGGTCATVNGKANCTCAAGFVGKRCETSAACSPNPCLNGAKCYVDGGGTQGCNCTAGYSGATCDTYDPCHASACKNNATCTVVNGRANCTCSAGWTGPRCSVSVRCTPNPCNNSGVCRADPGSTGFLCNCPAAWAGPDCSLQKRGTAASPSPSPSATPKPSPAASPSMPPLDISPPAPSPSSSVAAKPPTWSAAVVLLVAAFLRFGLIG